jgi:CheY-like chemotaxis protein
MNRAATILLVDDDTDDWLVIQHALKRAEIANPVRFLEDGQALMDYLTHQGPYADRDTNPLPAIIILDLNMPRKDGRQALKEIKDHPTLRRIPVLILSTSQNEIDTTICYQLGCSGFFTKPSTPDGFASILSTIKQYWIHAARLPGRTS